MVWGAIAKNDRLCLICMEGSINADSYMDMLEDNFFLGTTCLWVKPAFLSSHETIQALAGNSNVMTSLFADSLGLRPILLMR